MNTSQKFIILRETKKKEGDSYEDPNFKTEQKLKSLNL